MPIIKITHVTKEFKLGEFKSLRQSITNMVDRICGKTIVKRQNFKALNNINIEVESGEILGIIGTNGAGKSTLLKLISRITKPTKGQITVNGSIAPLIEVGAGLHPELTGRENIFLNASILGMPRSVVKCEFDKIVKFAELENFIDTPVKRFSSGMLIRLGFSIATSIDADILIVDEVLAVGDLAFQRKCFNRIEDLINKRGKTVILVSHNIRQVERLCSRVILLDQGEIIGDGKPDKVCELFYKRSNDKISSNTLDNQKINISTKNSGEIEFLEVDVLDSEGKPIDKITTKGTLRILVRFKLNQFVEKPEIVVGTHTTDFIYLTAGSTAVLKDRPNLHPGTHQVEYIISSFPLVGGVYCIRVAIYDRNLRVIFSGETLKMFSVLTDSKEVYEPHLRTLNLKATWKLNGQTITN